jgi:hypothetical protein
MDDVSPPTRDDIVKALAAEPWLAAYLERSARTLWRRQRASRKSSSWADRSLAEMRCASDDQNVPSPDGSFSAGLIR